MTEFPTLPAAYFFGYCERGAMACPACTRVVLLDSRRLSRQHWDFGPGRFQCPHCAVKLMIGLCAWQVPMGGGENWPPDKMPTPAEAAELRNLFGAKSIVINRRLRKGERSNVVIAAQCTCPLGVGNRGVIIQKDCPVHKGESRKVDPALADVNRKRGPGGVLLAVLLGLGLGLLSL